MVKVIAEVKKSLQFEITVHGCTGFYGYKKGKEPKNVFNSSEELDQYANENGIFKTEYTAVASCDVFGSIINVELTRNDGKFFTPEAARKALIKKLKSM